MGEKSLLAIHLILQIELKKLNTMAGGLVPVGGIRRWGKAVGGRI
jgi:hypothetical protein